MNVYRKVIEEEIQNAQEFTGNSYHHDPQGRQASPSNDDYWTFPRPIDDKEWTSARATPDCIVENYLYADVALLNAPGGTGKTTLILMESIHIALGMDLWGRKVIKKGPVLLITAEDSREMLVARMRSITEEMGLDADQVSLVQQHVRISDVSGLGCKLTRIDQNMVKSSGVVDDIIEGCRDMPPVLIIIDPAVSFGVGESRVNDAEQGLIEVARELRRKLNCCVRYVHHTGKVNAIIKSTSQYAGRGGSAFADGSRMVAIMHSHNAEEWRALTGEDLEKEEVGLVMNLPKVSYAPPQEPIYMVRKGFTFRQLVGVQPGKEPSLEAYANQMWQLLTSQLEKGVYHNKKSLEGLAPESNISRQKMRDALAFLLASGRVEERHKPRQTANGRLTKYLHPVEVMQGFTLQDIRDQRDYCANQDEFGEDD